MDVRWRRLSALAVVTAGVALVLGSFLPWEHAFGVFTGPSSHSGMDCVCPGKLSVALGSMLMGLGGLGAAPSLPASAREIVWVATAIVSVVAGWLVTILWADVRDDGSTVAVGIGVFVMAAGAALGLVGGIVMRVHRTDRRSDL